MASGGDFREDYYQELTALRVIFENVIFACQCGRLWAGECRLLGNESEKKDVRFFYLVGEFFGEAEDERTLDVIFHGVVERKAGD